VPARRYFFCPSIMQSSTPCETVENVLSRTLWSNQVTWSWGIVTEIFSRSIALLRFCRGILLHRMPYSYVLLLPYRIQSDGGFPWKRKVSKETVWA